MAHNPPVYSKIFNLGFLFLRWRLFLAALCLFAAPTVLRAGLPEPEITFYGRVYNNQQLVTSGNLRWTITPAGGGAAVTVDVTLSTINNGYGESWSYIVSIPAHSIVNGSDTPANTLSLDSGPANFTRAATINNQPVSIVAPATADISLSANNRGQVERVDLLIAGNAPNNEQPPAAPVLLGPTDGLSGIAPGTVLLDWLEASGATSYNLLLWRDGDAQPSNPTVSNINQSFFDKPGGLNSGERYFWQVIAVNAGGTTPSPRWSFTTNAGVGLPQLAFGASTYTVNEIQGQAHLDVNLTGSVSVAATAEFFTREIGSAVAGVNFQTASGNINLTQGSPQQMVDIPILNDGKPRDERVFQVALRNVVNALAPSPQVADVHIVDASIGSLLDYLLGKSNDGTGLDFNNDGKVDIADLTKQFNNLAPFTPSNPNPALGATNVDLRPTLTWGGSSPRDKSYQVYLWPATEARPASPNITGLTSPQAAVSTDLNYNTAYAWQVVAVGASESVEGPVWIFTTKPQPIVQIISPNNGTYKIGDALPVHWKFRSDAGTAARIEFWRAGAFVVKLGDDISATFETTTTVTVPNIATGSGYKLRVTSYWLEQQSSPEQFDESDGTFTINAP